MKNTRFLWKCYALAFISLIITLSTLAQVQTARYITTNPRSNAFYEYLPQGYNPSGSETYPLILFFHGIGELGPGTSTSLPLVLRNGPPKMISQGGFPNSFTVNGVTSKFIVISPQFTEWPGPSDIQSLLNYVIQNYKVDQTRVYLTGLSMGGGVTWDYPGSNPVYANRIAAIVPVCGALWPDQGWATNIAGANIGVWATHNNGDPTVPVSYTNDFIDRINTAPTPPSPLAKKTIFNANGHDAWTQTYNLNFKENNLNVFEWMLTHQRVIAYNPPPIVEAGPDMTITLPVNSVRYTATASDPGGSISIIRWTKVSGPAAGLIENPTGLWTNMINLVQGVYVFRLSVTDNGGALTTDDVTVTVNASGAANISPVADAGADKNITLPVNSITLTGSGTDSDGSISSYAWTKISGPAATISSPSSAVTSVTGLLSGTYTFRLTVTDNSGANSSDDVNVIVNSAATNQLPSANAGADKTLTLPANSTTLTGTGSDNDGTISTYAWSKVSGPSAGNIVSPASATTNISNLTEGTYIFKLTVTDNSGGSASDNVNVIVNPIIAPPPPGSGRSVKVNIYGGSNPFVNSQWNNWNMSSSLNSSNFLYDDQSASSVSASITDGNAMADNGSSYASGSTMVPPPVLRYNSYTTSNRTLTIKGLNPSSRYNLQFFASRANSGNKTVFQIGNISYTITTDNNSSDFANFTNIAPDNAGNVVVEMSRVGTYNYLAGFIISDGSVSANQAPVANAGADIAITLPVNNLTLTGTGTDTDGSISSYSWTKVSGPAAVISLPLSASTTVTGLLQGSYIFRLTVTDNSGASSSDDVNVTVGAATANQLPSANAGADKSIVLPVNSVSLTGSGADNDGTIVSYAWTKLSGPAATIISPASVTTNISSLTEGSYVFRLTVTDNSGGIASDDVNVTVTAALPPVTGRTIRVNLYGGSNPYANNQWNNWNIASSLNSTNFLYEDQSASTVNASLTDGTSIADNGANYAANTTIVPSQVLRYNSYNTSNRTLYIKGLNPSSHYTLQFFASRANSGNKTVVQTGNATDTINTDNNSTDYASLSGISPDNSGNINVDIARIGTYNYLAGFVIIEESVTTRSIMTSPATTAITNGSVSGDPVIKYLYDVQVFPNPVQSMLTVSITIPQSNTPLIISLIDVQGKVLYQKQFISADKIQRIQIDMSGMKQGVYTLNVKIAGKNINREVVKQ